MLRLPAAFAKLSTLATGEVSIIFHVPHSHAAEAIKLHSIDGPVTLEVRR